MDAKQEGISPEYFEKLAEIAKSYEPVFHIMIKKAALFGLFELSLIYGSDRVERVFESKFNKAISLAIADTASELRKEEPKE